MTSENPNPLMDANRAEALFADWAARVEGGESDSIEELVAAHPALEAELRRLHEDWKLFAPLPGRVVPGLIASDHGVAIAPLSGSEEEDLELPSHELLERLRIETPNSGRYKFRAVIGRGGGGVVLKVWDSKLHRPLAMKVVLGRGEERPSGDTPRIDGRTLTRFVDEARIASQLNHPGIVPVHELGTDESGRAFFTMKLVRGEDLSRVFEHVRTGHDGWSQARALGVLQRACEAMAFAHEKRVVHRDLKPANVMVGRHGEVYVMDWGLARVLGEKDHRDLRLVPVRRASASMVDSLRRGERDATPDSPLVTMDGSVIGTPAYMSPEQARGELEAVGPRSDVYALGAMLYELLAGEPPFVPGGARISPHTVLMRVLEGPPRPLEELAPRTPPELVAICERAMARDASRRYPDVPALAAELRAFQEGRVVAAYESGTWAEMRKWVLRNRGLVGALAATMLVLAAGVAVALVLKERAEDQTRIAQANERDAEEARDEAELSERKALRQLYVASVRGAQSALRSKEPASVRRFLDEAPVEHRNWEWGYLDAVSDTSLLRLEGYSASFSPDGTRIVTAGGDNTARVWDASSGAELAVMRGHQKPVAYASFSQDGKRIVTASLDCTARIWDANSAAELSKLEGHTLWVDRARFSLDGRYIVTASLDKTARVWDASSSAEISRVNGRAASFSPAGTRIVTASSDETARVWDSFTGAELLSLAGHTDHVSSASFSPDGTRIVTASWDRTARVWDASSGEGAARLEGHTDHVISASFSPDGTRIVTASRDNTARVWDASSGRELTRLDGHTKWVSSASFSPGGSRIVTGSSDGTVRVWDAGSSPSHARLDGHTVQESKDVFSPDGTRIVTASSANTARIWDASSGEELARLEGHTGPLSSARFGPDGTRIVTASWDNTARVWDASSGAELAVLDGHTDSVLSASFSPDGTRIVSASGDHTARVWNASTGAELARLEGHTNWLSSASFSPDGTQVVTASDDNTARVWDASSGAELAVMRGHSWAVKCPSFSPDGTRIVTSGITSARVWDASGGAELTRLDEPRGLEIRAVFSLDGSRVVTAASNGNVRVWDASSGVELVHLEGHTDDVNSAVFNPDGARIVTASDDNTARVWDASSGAELARLDGHTDRVFSADFSPDGARIITSSADGTARVWDSVPYRIRYAERKRLEAVAPEARALLDSAREHSHDWSVIADELRTDASLSPIMRQATLRELSRIANPIVLEARKLANELRARLLFAEDVVAHIEADESLAADLRHEALRVAKRFGNEPAELHAVAWDAVESPGADPDRLQRALRAARIAAEQSPDGGDIVTTLGVALYRTGDFAGALETLTRSNGLNEDDKPADVAFMAMTHFRLGHVQEANTELERLRGMVDNQSDDDDRRYLEEAEAALAAPSDDRR